MQNLEKKVKSPSFDLHQEVEDYIDFLMKRRIKIKKWIQSLVERRIV